MTLNSTLHDSKQCVEDFIRLHLLDDANQVGSVSEVTVVLRLALLTGLAAITVEVVDPGGVETAQSSIDTVHLVALHKQELHKIAAILIGDHGNQRGFGSGLRISVKSRKFTNGGRYDQVWRKKCGCDMCFKGKGWGLFLKRNAT